MSLYYISNKCHHITRGVKEMLLNNTGSETKQLSV